MADNLLSLEEWREQIVYNPWHFWQLAGPSMPVTSACNSIVRQYAWQGAGSAGRNEIAQAIQTAEERILPYLGFAPAPRYKTFTLPFPRYPQTNVNRLGYAGSDNRWIPIQLPEGYIIASGVEKKTALSLANAVVYSDTDSDGLSDTFTVTFNTTVTDPTQIAIYFQSTDRLYQDGAIERWRIKPVRVSIAGGVCTVKGRAWMLVKPSLYEGTLTDLDASIAANYVTAVDVYQKITNYDGITVDDCQATLIWETTPYPIWAVAPGSITYGRDPAAQGFAIARVGIRDSVNGIVTLGQSVYDTTNSQWVSVPWYSGGAYNPPDRVEIRVLCGYPLASDSRMNNKFSTLIARLAAAELNQSICACQEANRELYRWQFDLARSSGNAGEAYGLISSGDLNNPLGTKRGQVQAYKDAKVNRVIQGFTV